MKKLKLHFSTLQLILILCMVFLKLDVKGAARYWIATTTTNWNSTANWSTSSGGSGGASVPTSSDDVYFNSAKVGSCNIDANANALSFTISTGYTGTITQNTGITLYVSGPFSQAAGTFTGGNSTITVTGGFTLTAGTFTATTGSFIFYGGWTKTQSAGTFNHNNGTVFCGGSSLTMDVYTTETFYNFSTYYMTGSQTLSIASGDIIKTTGTLTLYDGLISYITSAGYMEAQGNVTIYSYFDGGTQPLYFSGTADQTFDLTGATANFNSNVTINKSSGTVTMASACYLDGNYTLNLLAGTLNLNGQTVEVNNGSAGTLNGPTASTTFTVSGTGSLKAYNYSQTNSASVLTFSSTPTFHIYNSFTISAGTFTCNASTATVVGAFLISGGTFNAPSTNMYSSGSWTRSSGTFNHNSGTVTFNGSSSTLNISGASIGTEAFYNLTLNKSTGQTLSVSQNDTIKTTGLLSLYDGLVSHVSGSGALRAEGNVTVSLYYDGGDQPLFFSNTSNQNFDLTGATANFNADVVIKKSSGIVTMVSGLYLDGNGEDLYLLSGTLNLNAQTVQARYASTPYNNYIYGPVGTSTSFTVSGTGNLNGNYFSQTSGTSSSTFTISGASSFYIYYDLALSTGTFNSNSATVTVAGALNLTGGTFNASSGTMNIYGNWTRYSAATFNHNNGTVVVLGSSSTFDFSQSSIGTETFNNLTVNRTTGQTMSIASQDTVKVITLLTLYDGLVSYVTSSGAMRAEGDVSVSTYWDGGNEPLFFSGTTTTQTFTLTSASANFNASIVIKKSLGSVTMATSCYLDGSGEHLYLMSGTLNLNGQTVEAYYSTSPNNYIYGPTGSGTTFTVSGSGNLKGYYYSQATGSGTLTISGASTFHTYSSFNQGAGTFNSSSATVTIAGDFNLTGGTFNATTGTMTSYGGWTRYSAATFNHNSGTVNFVGSSATLDISQSLIGTETFYNLTVNKSTGQTLSVSISDTIKTLGLLSLFDGLVSYVTTSGALRAEGNVTVSSNWDGGNEPLFFSNTGNQNFDLTGATLNFNADVVIKKSGGIVTMLSSLYLDGNGEDLYLLSGTLNLNAKTVEARYSLSPYNNYIYGPVGTNTTFTVSGTGNLNGNYFSQTSGTSTSSFIISSTSTFYTYYSLSLSTGTFTSNTATVTVAGDFNLTGGTFNATSGTMTISGSWTRQGSSTFNHNNGTILANGSSSTFDFLQSSIGTEIFYNFTLNKSTGQTLNIASQDTIKVLALLSLYDGLVSYVSSSGALRADGNVTVSQYYDGGNEPLFFSGTNNQDFNLASATLNFNADVIIKKSSGIVTMLSSMYLDGSGEDLYLRSGTLNLNGQTVQAYYATSPNNYIHGPNGTSTTFTVSGTGSLNGYFYSQTGGTSTSTFTISGASTFHIYSSFTLSTGIFNSNTATVNMVGGYNLSGGTFNATSNTMTTSSDWTHSGGTFNHNNGTVTWTGSSATLDISGASAGTETFYNLTINKNGGQTQNVAASDIIKTVGTLTLYDGLASYIASAGYFDVEGPLSISSSYWDGGTLPIKLMGSADQSFTIPSNYAQDLTINKSGGTANLSANLTLSNANQDLIIAAGTLDLNGYNLTVNGSGYTFVVQSGATLQLLGTETSTTPTLNSGSIVRYDGTGTSYTIKSWTYSNLTIAGGASTTYSLPANLSGVSTLSISSGTFSLAGYNLTTTTLSNDATLKLQGNETVSITTMDVNSGTVLYTGRNISENLTVKDFNGTDYYNLTINDVNATKATFILGAAMVVTGELSVSSGTYSGNGQTTTVTGLTTVNGGTYTLSTATQTLNGGLLLSSGTITGSTGNFDINGSVNISGGTFTAPSTNTYVSGDWTRSGTFTPGTGTVIFDGASTQTLNSATTFNNFTISNSNGLTLGAAMTMSGTLNLSSGRISLGANNIVMSSGSVLTGGSSSSFAYTGSTGVFKWNSCAASTTKTFPVGHTNSTAGYTPLVITFNTGHTTDDFSVAAYDKVCDDGTRTGTTYTSLVVKATWNITETVSGGSNVNLQFQWNASDEGTSFVRSSCRMAHYTNSAWENVGSLAAASGSNPYTFTHSSYTGTFSPFGMNGGGGPLPVELLYFKAQELNGKALLTWATASEINNDFFTVEKSWNGKDFYSIGYVNGAGQSNQTLSYSFTDDSLFMGMNYYRIKQTDFDGKFEYSPIETLNGGKKGNSIAHIKLFPIPAKDKITLLIPNGNKREDKTVKIINHLGANMLPNDLRLTSLQSSLDIDLQEFNNGLYFIIIDGSDGTITRSFYVNK